MKRYASAIGLTTPEQVNTVAGHSLRAGLVTSAIRAKKGGPAIRRQTGRTTSKTTDIHDREESLFEDNAAAGLL